MTQVETADAFADAALGCVGTRFQAHGREPGKGLDCVGLVICAARSVGVEIPDREYVIGPGCDLFDAMTEGAESVFVPGEMPLKRGDALTLRFPKMPFHAAIFVGGNRIVHAMVGRGVGLMGVDHSVLARIQGVWRLP